MRLLVRLLINAVALWAAVKLVSGVSYTGGVLPLLGVALVFGVVNAIVRPVVKLLSFPFIILTLGLFTFVVNALMLWLTSAVSASLGLGFHVSGFGAAFWGALVISIVNVVLSVLVPDEEKK
ncbi:MAG TPA: phage holin family protein [Gemmatimonadaceae bacterium]|nr:phage holin family protein [Gemmatimonadaceae bacterium]